MPVFETTVQSVTQRVITTRDGRNSTIYDIVDGSNRKWSTFKQPLANEANRLIGQQVELTGRIETNDRGYENNYLDDVRLGTGAQQRANPAEQAMRTQPAPEAPRQAIPEQAPPASAGPTLKDVAIARQVAAKVSAGISTDAVSFWANLDPLVTYFLFGLKPPEFSGPFTNTPAADVAKVIERAIPKQNEFIPAGAYADPGPEAGRPAPDEFEDLPF